MGESEAYIYFLHTLGTDEYYIGWSTNPEQRRTDILTRYVIHENNLELLDFRGTVKAPTRKEVFVIAGDVRRDVHEFAANEGERARGLRGFWFRLDQDQFKAVRQKTTELCEEYSVPDEADESDDYYDEINELVAHVALLMDEPQKRDHVGGDKKN